MKNKNKINKIKYNKNKQFNLTFQLYKWPIMVKYKCIKIILNKKINSYELMMRN